jgi:hypothetical protein
MSYVLGSLGGFGSLGAAPSQPAFDVAAIVEVVTVPFDVVLRPIIKAQLLANAGANNDKIFNGVRFLDANISAAKAAERAQKSDYAQPYKAYRDAVEKALDAAKKKDRSVRSNALKFKLFSMIDGERQAMQGSGLLQPPKDDSKKGDGDAKAASTKDNTMLYVAGAAVLALVAIGASRRKA